MLLPIAHEKTELIEVVRIVDPIRHITSEDLTGEEVATWEAPRTGQVLSLIRDLPGSELQRCFIPGWGIRARSATTDLLLHLAFCFDCHGVRLWGPGVPAGHEALHSFDPDSAAAQELLQQFRDAGSG
ncbi:hypothetical protein ABZ016_13205 [Streptomyces sp. NPDC006372]|uniref:hypothetical protein n=1 Tax=Streptomyces sp. NPDC006372 TaxID=3155599 RepID=UPI0033BEC609